MLALVVVVLAAMLVFVGLVAAMVLYPPLNKALAKRIGAPPGRSFSAQLWVLEQDPAAKHHRFGKWMRPKVDALFSARQEDHCAEAYLREAGNA